MEKDEIVKTEIITKAQKLFQQYGLKKTTMDEIASACGKAKSTLYHYFKNKEEVFDEVIGIELQNLRLAVDTEVRKHSTLIEKLKSYFNEFHIQAYRRMNLYRILQKEINNKFDEISQYSRIIEFEKTYVSRIIKVGVENGEFHGLTEKEIPWFSEKIILAFLGIIEYSLKSEDEPNLEEFTKISNIIIPRIFI